MSSLFFRESEADSTAMLLCRHLQGRDISLAACAWNELAVAPQNLADIFQIYDLSQGPLGDGDVALHFVVVLFKCTKTCILPSSAPFGWNYKPAEKHCWLIFCERKILFRLKKQAE
jgi:hypothetical protein